MAKGKSGEARTELGYPNKDFVDVPESFDRLDEDFVDEGWVAETENEEFAAETNAGFVAETKNEDFVAEIDEDFVAETDADFVAEPDVGFVAETEETDSGNWGLVPAVQPSLVGRNLRHLHYCYQRRLPG